MAFKMKAWKVTRKGARSPEPTAATVRGFWVHGKPKLQASPPVHREGARGLRWLRYQDAEAEESL